MEDRWTIPLVKSFITRVNIKLISKSEIYLIPNYITHTKEKLVFVIYGFLEQIHTQKYNGDGLMILTNKRIVFIRKSFFGTITSEIIYLSNITSCSFKKTLLGSGEIDLRMSNNSARVTHIEINDANKMHHLINQALQSESYKDTVTTPPVTNTPPVSAVDEIEKYYDLFTKGIITKEDFESKKKQLLNI